MIEKEKKIHSLDLYTLVHNLCIDVLNNSNEHYLLNHFTKSKSPTYYFRSCSSIQCNVIITAIHILHVKVFHKQVPLIFSCNNIYVCKPTPTINIIVV